ncbi:MAG: pyrimidine-nucleoside phosphorylase, partial [Thermoanaerobacterales bacterium]|nr:pyrimidine-nucleoside phosphorylase [Thermoanaerobacterales bacterium]
GGNPDIVDDLSLLPQAKYKADVIANSDGYVKQIDALRLGVTAMKLGAGRQYKNDVIDHAVGVVINSKVGDFVKSGQKFATVLANNEKLLEWGKQEVDKSFEFTNEKVEKRQVIFAKVTKEGIFEFKEKVDDKW